MSNYTYRELTALNHFPFLNIGPTLAVKSALCSYLAW